VYLSKTEDILQPLVTFGVGTDANTQLLCVSVSMIFACKVLRKKVPTLGFSTLSAWPKVHLSSRSVIGFAAIGNSSLKYSKAEIGPPGQALSRTALRAGHGAEVARARPQVSPDREIYQP